MRLLGGVGALRALLARTGPAVTRRLAGAPVAGGRELEVVAVRALGYELPMYDITTGTGDFVAEGVISHNCFARNTHTYLDMDAGADFDRQIVVKVNVARVLRRELRSPRWSRRAGGDGHQHRPLPTRGGPLPADARDHRRVRPRRHPVLGADEGHSAQQGPARLAAAAADVPVSLGVSIALLDRAVHATLEPGTPTPAARLDLVRRITDAGLPCGVMVAPVLPLLTDSAEALDACWRGSPRRAPPGRACWRCTCGPAPASGSWPGWSASTRSWSSRTPGCTGAGRMWRPEYRRALAARVAPLLRRHGLDRGHAPPVRAAPPIPTEPPRAEQLALL